MNVNKLKHPKDAKAALAEIKSKMARLLKAIETKESNDEDASVDQAEFDALKDDHDETKDRLAVLESRVLDDDDEKSDDDKEDKNWFKAPAKAAPVATKSLNINFGAKAPLVPGQSLARKALANFVFETTRNIKAAHAYVEKGWGSEEADRISKDLTSTGQPVVAQDYQYFIELLRAKSFLRQICNVISMANGNMTIPRQISGTIAGWINEGVQIPVSQINIDTINLIQKKLAAMTYCTREFLGYAAFDAASLMTDDLVRNVWLLEESTFLTGTTVSPNVPLGLQPQITQANQLASTTANGEVNFQTVSYDIARLCNQLEVNLIETADAVLVMNPGVKNFLMQLSSTFGVYPFREELSKGTLNGWKVYTTTMLPTNGATGTGSTAATNGSSVIAMNPKDVIIADSGLYALETSREGSFQAGGVQYNMFGQDLVGFKVANHVDLALRHTNSLAVLNTVDWSLSNLPGYFFSPDTPDLSGSRASGAIGRTAAP